ncbi:peptidogalycan biosysnthesis protein [Pedobacter endophyticus]|uniref:N-acetyltransferase n=1 Tax=Pedobacter endophyticus TaxID=2789740 RepID=A0A7U3SPA4_9SPHI|nr:peptidogalycan biosysnthesis protein [Pedobacter endophyticus]QPH38258.1 N-acetyltransferase [Pedobacter endophyticus]
MTELNIVNNSLSAFCADKPKTESWNLHVATNNFTLTLDYLHLYNKQDINTFFYTGSVKGEIIFICLISILKIRIAGFPIAIAMFGAPKTNGKAFWHSENHISYSTFVKQILQTLKKQYKFYVVILREFYGTADQPLMAKNQDMGFLNHHALVKSYLNIASFASFEDYFNALPSKKRNYFRSVMKCKQDSAVSVGLYELTPELVDLIYPLYQKTNAKAKENRTAAVNRSVFSALCDSKIKTKVITYNLQNKIAAFGLMFFNSREVKCLFTGFDYRFTKTHNLWYQIMLESIRFAIDQRCLHIDMGSSSASMKDKFQAGHEDVYISVLLKNPVLTAIFKKPVAHLLNKFLRPTK